MAHLNRIYFKRLKITILSNGITFYEDIRDRHHWVREFLRVRESTVMEEMPEDIVMEGLIREISDLPVHEINKILKDVTGKWWELYDTGND